MLRRRKVEIVKVSNNDHSPLHLQSTSPSVHFTFSPLHLQSTSPLVHFTFSPLHLQSTSPLVHFTFSPLHLQSTQIKECKKKIDWWS
ncbi:hypothetical protein Bpfe_028078 [Biomphalaria pfeifferi]|uniref:Uncharacterized protein n=1 Tax=Biomphalaria pfeifferi TaxID=112525 RepID=A0AAD8AVE1_BIOPF|nr:hypothetical protein Bpfe_028078 [Biomphalaria pfeifferi]